MPVWNIGWARKFLKMDKVVTVPSGTVTLTSMASGLTFRNRGDGDIPGVISAFMSRGIIALTGLAPTVTLSQVAVTAPTAAASVSPTTIQPGQSVTLNTSGSHAGTNPVSSWSVVWGDGSANSTGAGLPPITIPHTYAAAGSFAPVLTITDNTARTGVATAQTVTVAVTLPAAPSNLVVTIISASQIKLDWMNNATNATAVVVERSTNGAPFVVIQTLAATATNYTAAGLTASTTYSFRVKATNSAGSSPYSNTATGTTRPNTVDLGGFRPQFPPAFGMDGVFGRGDGVTVPVIFKVNTLNCETPATLASGAGTRADPFVFTSGLRAAMTAAQQREVTFTVSGNIVVSTPIFVTTPYMAVRGQTAPSPGITLTAGDYTGTGGAGVVEINTHDVLLQHFRIRGGVAGYSNLGVWDESIYGLGTRPHHVVFDHISGSQGMDENFYGDADDYCYWRCLAGESLYGNNIDSQGLSAGHGFLIIDSQRSAAIGCLAHSCGRGPEIHDFTTVFVGDFLNHNGCGPSNQNNPAASLWYQSENGVTLGTYVNFRAQQGPTTPDDQAAVFYYIPVPNSKIYFEDCTVTGTYVLFRFFGADPRVLTPPVAKPAGWSSVGSVTLRAWIAANVGARPLDRDPVDTRYISELNAGTGQWVHSPQAIPALAVNSPTWTLPGHPFDVVGPFGRTNFDLWAEGLAAALEPAQ